MLNYRAEIDGLRALAVLLVFFYHLDISFITGGFAGVDVFYVISGFVIYRSMIEDQKAGRYSIWGFYRKRARRIIPALAVTIIASLFAGYFLLTPSGYVLLGQSSLASIFSVSNIYFYDRLGYFAASANNIPLLHTWSLGVEEQFYLIAPVCFLLFCKYCKERWMLAALLTFTILSFIYSLMASFVVGDENHAFYLPMSRFWEIGVGCVIAILERRFSPSYRWPTFLALIGLAGIFATGIVIDKNTPFPGFAALLPVGASALFILAALPQKSLLYRFMASYPMAYLGRISYSVYLFHWPIVVFAGLNVGREFHLWEKGTIFVSTLLLASLSYHFLETPFRKARTIHQWKQAWRILAVLVAIIVGVSLTIISSAGMSGRMSQEAKSIAQKIKSEKSLRPRCPTISVGGEIKSGAICQHFGVENGIDYVLWGDSHAGMIMNQLAQRMHQLDRVGVTVRLPSCPPLLEVYTSKRKNREQCQLLGEYIVSQVESENAPVVVFANRWANLASDLLSPSGRTPPKRLYDRKNDGARIGFYEAVKRTIDELNALGVHVVIIGPVPEMDFHVPEMMIRAANWNTSLPVSHFKDFMARQKIVLDAFDRIDELPNATIVYPHEVLCNETQCRFNAGTSPLYTDEDHLSADGVSLILPLISKAINGALMPAQEKR